MNIDKPSGAFANTLTFLYLPEKFSEYHLDLPTFY